MLMKASYILLSTASLGLLLFEAPRASLLTRTPDRGKVQRQAQTIPSGNATVRGGPHFVFLGGGYHGGK
jgi:hypothetical protein